MDAQRPSNRAAHAGVAAIHRPLTRHPSARRRAGGCCAAFPDVIARATSRTPVRERWGRDRADTLIANHNARLFGSGIADRATLDYLGAVLGDEEIQKVSTHRQRHQLEVASRTYSNDFKRLAAPDRVRQTDRNSALLIYANLPPAWITLRPWYHDRQLRAQVTAPPAAAAAAPLAPTVAEDVA